MKRVCSCHLTGDMLSQNLSEKIKSFRAKNKAYYFMNTIDSTQAYWKKLFYEALAMVKHLRLPTFYLKLSWGDLRWDDLISVET